MKFKSHLLILIFLFSSFKAFAIPRCEELYEAIYNDPIRKDVNLLTVENHKTIGIELEKYWNEDKELSWTTKDGIKKTTKVSGWSLKKDKDGYFSIGKLTKRLFSNLGNKIEIGDTIISINNVDLRKLMEDEGYGDEDELANDVSNLFKENEPIIFKIRKRNSTKVITLDKNYELLKNSLESFNRPYIDFYINSIDINEKEGRIKASIETNFREKLDGRYFLTEAIWNHIVYNKKFEENKLKAFEYETCSFSDEKWDKLNSVDPAYGMKFDNLIKEDKQTRTSEYHIKHRTSYLDYHNNDNGYLQNKADIYYKSNSTYSLKNEFNLKAFPFDKQQIKISIYNSSLGIDNFRPKISNFTISRALYFKNQNNIEGWNITDVKTSHDIDDDPTTFTKHERITIAFDVERKSRYYVFKIIFPIILILIICWSAVWINPKEIESRLTITIVCLLSLIAYNFVIDSDLPKLEYLTIMDYIILISYIYAAIPNFLSIISHNLIKNKKVALVKKYENYEKKYGLPSYLLIVLLIIIISTSQNSDHAASTLAWLS